MSSTAEVASSSPPLPRDPHTKDEFSGKLKRGLARLRLGADNTAPKKEKEADEEYLNSTVVVTSRPPPPDANDLRTPINIHLHEKVFVHYPPSAPLSPFAPHLSPPAEVRRSSSLPQLEREHTAGSHHGRTFERHGSNSPLSVAALSRNLQQRTWLSNDGSVAGPSQRGPIQHEHDHDCCPFTAIRRAEAALRVEASIPRTSPFDWSHLLSSFSVKNAFMFYPPPPTYGFVRDAHGDIQVRSETGKRAPQLDHERIEYIRRHFRISNDVPDDMVGGALHGIASPPPPPPLHGGDTAAVSEDDPSQPSFKLIFIPWENELQSYYIRSGSVVFGRRVKMGRPLFALAWPCPIPCSIIRPHRRMSSHVAIFFHCNGEDIGRPSCLRLLTLANALHMTILVPEYPGYGLFEGCPSEASVKGSMERVVEFLFSSDPSLTPSRVILMGHSIGTGVAVHIAKVIQNCFLRLCDHPELNSQLPYACPMSRYRVNVPGKDTAAPRCATGTAVAPFSVIPRPPSPRPHPSGKCPHRAGQTTPLPPPAGSFTPPDASLHATEAGGNALPQPRDGETHIHRSCHQHGETHEGHNSEEHSGCTHATPRAPYGEHDCSCQVPPREDKQTPFSLCSHYALGGIILLAPFASVRCVEKWEMLQSYGLNVQEMERRRLLVPEDVLVSAPEDWAEDARELRRSPGEDPPDMSFLRPSPWLFDLARYISFNRFPSIDVAAELQETTGFFNQTPLLLLHGAQDVLVPAINSVAIASKLRQCTGGRSAKVYLGFLHSEGHNNLHCSHITRRFYKDVILMPHLRRQQELRDELEETLRSGLGNSNHHHDNTDGNSGSHHGGAAPMHAPSHSGESPGAAGSQSPSRTQPPAHVPSPAATAAAASNGVVQSKTVGKTRSAPLFRSPTTVSHQTTEPIDEERPDAPVSSEPISKHPSLSELEAGADSDAPTPRHPTEPYLYFIEPAYNAKGAKYIDCGSFAGPVKIRLLHAAPPSSSAHGRPERSAPTTAAGGEENEASTSAALPLPHHAGEEQQTEAPAPHDANVFVTRPPILSASPTTNSCRSPHHRQKVHTESSPGAAVPPSSGATPTMPALGNSEDGKRRDKRRRHHRSRHDEASQQWHVSEEFEGALRDTLQRTQPLDTNFAPAAAMLHIALFHHLDHYDVGSIAVASVTKYSVNVTAACQQRRRYRRNSLVLRLVIATYYFIVGSFLISLAICHGVLTRPSHLQHYLPAGTSTHPYHVDARVIVWGVLDGTAFFVLAVIRFFNKRLGIGNLSKYRETSRASMLTYTIARVTAYVLFTAVGIFMAMILALTPPNRGGVDWERWTPLPYSQRVWISYLPRWTMVTSASIHIFFVVVIFLKNH